MHTSNAFSAPSVVDTPTPSSMGWMDSLITRRSEAASATLLVMTVDCAPVSTTKFTRV